MPKVPIGYVELWVGFVTAGDPETMYTTMGFEIADPPFTQANCISLGNAVMAILQVPLSNFIRINGAIARVGSDGGDLVLENHNTADGQVSVQCLPNNSAVLVRRRTAAGGRRSRGRMFIPGVSKDGVDATGTLSAGTRGVWQAAASALMEVPATPANNVSNLVLFHQSAPFDPTPIISLSVDSKISTQRRRMRP